jgi:hypothetical protein
MWVATPLSYDFFIHYTSPVITGTQGVLYEQKSYAEGSPERPAFTVSRNYN